MDNYKSIKQIQQTISLRRNSFVTWELIMGLTISAAVFFNHDVHLSYTERFFKVLATLTLMFIIISLSWLSLNIKFFKKHSYFKLLFLFIKIFFIHLTVQYYGFGLNAFLYLIIPFEAYFMISENFGALLFFGLILVLFVNQDFKETLLKNIPLAWTFISIDILFLFLSFLLMKDFQNDQLKNDLFEKLQQSHKLLEEYARNIAEFSVVEERSRIAREIHDSVGHYLTAVSLQLDRASIYIDKDKDEVELAIQAAKLASSEALQDVRSSVAMLREGGNLFDFHGEIDKLIEGIRPYYEINYLFSGSSKNYNNSVLLVLFRSLQEGITNIQKHTDASKISVTIILEEKTGKMILEDDGKGFDVDFIMDDSSNINSFGLSGMFERVELVLGEINLQSDSEQGTRIEIVVPSDPVLKLTERGFYD